MGNSSTPQPPFRAMLRLKKFARPLPLAKARAKPNQLLMIGVCSLLVSKPALAQLIPDTTTGTQIQPNTDVRGLPSDLIEGGTIRSNSLFHSFQEFNIAPSQGVYFVNPLDIANIFSRITGNNTSNIDGTLGVLGNANLFLLNPNGIIFGPSATLDIPGSFTASTAESFTFGEGLEFSAANPQAPPLLTLNVTPGVQLGRGDINNAGNLVIPNGQTLTFQGRNITHTGNLIAPGGTVGLFGQTVGILDDALIDVSDRDGGGTVWIGGLLQGANPELNAQRAFIGPDTRIVADALRSGNGGTVAIWSDQVTGFYGDITARGANNSALISDGGFVEVSSDGHLIFRGAVDTAAQFGQTGILLLDPTTITIANGTADSAADGTDRFAGNTSGLAGQILSAPLSLINDEGPTTIFESELEGLAGDTDIILQATDGITVEDLADNQLRFSDGTGRIAFIGDANSDGIGDVVMLDSQDVLATNGRNIAISGANLLLGSILTQDLSDAIIIDVDAGGAIPATGTSGTAQFSFTVPDGVGILNDVDVRFSAAHTFNSDLTATLTSPTAQSLILFSAVGGGGDNFQDTVLDDGADAPISSGTAPFIGSFFPDAFPGLRVFSGQVADGIWLLDVVDNFELDAGTLFRAGDPAPWGTALGTQLLLTTVPQGSGGSIDLTASGNVVIDSIITTARNSFDSTGGNVTIEAGGAVSLEGVISTVGLGGSGDIAIAGQSDITTGTLETAVGLIGPENGISGDGGNIVISSTLGNITTGNLRTSNERSFRVTDDFARQGGSVTINTDGGAVSLGNIDTSALGGSGGIAIAAQSDITTGNLDTSITTFIVGPENGISGDGGDISIATTLGNITTGELDSSTFTGPPVENWTGGDGGNITLSSTSGSIQASGLRAGTRTQAGSNAIGGRGGDVSIATTSGNINLTDSIIFSGTRTFASTNTTGGKGGDIFIATDSGDVLLSEIFSETRTVGNNVTGGAGGNITVSTLSGDIDTSGISTETRTGGGTGEIIGATGGNVLLSTTTGDIDTTSLFTRSRTSGSAGGNLIAGNGGQVSITSTEGNLTVGGIDAFTDATLPSGTITGGRGGNIVLSSNSGNILTSSFFDATSSSSSLSATILGGDGGNISIVSGSGDIAASRLVTYSRLSSPMGFIRGGNGGNIFLSSNSGNISPSILESYVLSSASDGNMLSGGNAGDISIFSGSSEINLKAPILAFSTTAAGPAGNGGNISLITEQNNITGTREPTSAILHTFALSENNAGSGNGGQVILSAQNQISDVDVLTVSSQGQAGNLLINGSDSFLLDTVNLITSATVEVNSVFGPPVIIEVGGVGESGDVDIIGTGDLTLSNSTIISSAQGIRDAGDIRIDSLGLITIQDESELSSNTVSSGAAGNIDIKSDTGILVTGANTFLSAITNAQGRAGNITLDAPDISLEDGATVQTNTQGIGNAGTIEVNAEDTLRLDGAAIAANTTATATGRGGNINVTANTARLNNGSISVNSQGQGRGGDIAVDAGLISLRNQSNISATTTSTDGGNIDIQAEDALLLADRSEINATAGTAAAGGNGGNITINAPFVVALQEGQNRIVAEAFQGNGGNINIATIALLGADVLDISASSQFGLDGDVSIDSPNLDPARGLTQLPINLADASNQIANACAIDRQGQAQFIATGRGGLPITPATQPTGIYLLADLGSDSGHGIGQSHPVSQTAQLQEAQAWSVASTGNIVLTSDNPLTQLLQQAAQAYYQADYQQAANLWHRAAIQVSQGNEPLTHASILSNLALAYLQLGDWQQANATIITSQQLLTPEVVTPQVLAQVLNTRASLHLSQGNTQKAIADWQQATAIYQHIGNRSGYQQSLLNYIQVLQSLGLYRQAQNHLEEIITALENQPYSPQKAIALLTLGNSLRTNGETSQAQQTLETALAVAQQLNQPELTSQILLNLGHTAKANPDQALSYYEQALVLAPTPLRQFQASISKLRLLATEDPSTAQRFWTEIENTFQPLNLPISQESIYAQLNLVHTLLNYDLEATSESTFILLNQVSQRAEVLQDPILQTYALGYQGDFYGRQQQWEQAEAFTQKAFRQAQTLQAPEVIYPVALQLGRLQKSQGKRTQAIDAYSAAIDALEILRKDLITTSDDVQFTFRDDVEPIYREFVKLLLQKDNNRSPAKDDLKRARKLIENLQVAEVNDYFQDACIQGSPVLADEVDPTAAVIYPILLDDQLDVIVSVGNDIQHYSQSVSSQDIEKTVRQVLSSLTSPIRASLPRTTQQQQKLYDWLLKPAEPYLAQHNIENLVFVADGVLRTLPLTTLYDGEQYLIEKYNVVLSPGLSLLEPRSLQRQDLEMLAGGLSEARPGFSALPFVPDELQQVTTQIPDNQVLFNQTLTKPNLLNSLKTAPASVVHLATHGEFGATVEDTFIVTWDGKLTMEEMSQVLQARNRSDLSPVELLVFSACKTASGDSRAVLGIAGTAIRSGVRSTLAGLWAINDQAAAAFMTEFYKALAQPDTTKAEAFRQAQLALMQDPQLASPYFWSPFVLVGNWL